jgi:hypothetical protein
MLCRSSFGGWVVNSFLRQGSNILEVRNKNWLKIYCFWVCMFGWSRECEFGLLERSSGNVEAFVHIRFEKSVFNLLFEFNQFLLDFIVNITRARERAASQSNNIAIWSSEVIIEMLFKSLLCILVNNVVIVVEIAIRTLGLLQLNLRHHDFLSSFVCSCPVVAALIVMRRCWLLVDRLLNWLLLELGHHLFLVRCLTCYLYSWACLFWDIIKKRFIILKLEMSGKKKSDCRSKCCWCQGWRQDWSLCCSAIAYPSLFGPDGRSYFVVGTSWISQRAARWPSWVRC